jgi:hypothetical protein
MDKRKRIEIEEEIDKTLAAMDRMEKLEAGPYFYTRLKPRLDSREKKATARLPGTLLSRMLRPVLVTLLLLLNVVTALLILSDTGKPAAEEKALYSYVSTLTGEYWQEGNSYADYFTGAMSGGDTR